MPEERFVFDSDQRSWVRLAGALGLVAITLAGGEAACVATGFTDGQFLCDPQGADGQCPEGQQCAPDGRCRSSWDSPAAGGGGSTAGSGGGGQGAVGGGGGTSSGTGGGTGGTCQSLTCADYFPSCGPGLFDPCTGTPLDCSGACPPPSVCGGAGTAGVCGCPPTVLSQTATAGVVENHPPGAGASWQPSSGGFVYALAASDQIRLRPPDTVPQGTYMRRLNLRQFGFSIPGDATVVGIRVSIEKSAGYPTSTVVPVRDTYVQLHYEGDNVSALDLGSAVAWPLADEVWQYGSPTVTWGTAFTPAMINHSEFGARLRCRLDTTPIAEGRPRIDWVQIEVFYEPACPVPGL